MIAVEGLRDCLRQWHTLRILKKHRRPGDRLQRDPMQPDHATKCENHDGAANAAKHDPKGIERAAVRQTTRAVILSGAKDLM